MRLIDQIKQITEEGFSVVFIPHADGIALRLERIRKQVRQTQTVLIGADFLALTDPLVSDIVLQEQLNKMFQELKYIPIPSDEESTTYTLPDQQE